MTSKHLVDKELILALDAFPSLELNVETLPSFRKQFDQMVSGMPRLQDTYATSELRRIPGFNGPDVEVVIWRPRNQSAILPAILHMHGGGYLVGSALMSDASARQMVRQLVCVVVSVNYRLCPETKHPGPVEDCYSALKWLHETATEFRIDRDRIVVTGESAGGGLAAALALLARDRGHVKIIAQHLNYPMIDDRSSISKDPHPYTGEFAWTAKNNYFGWSALLGGEPGDENVSPYAAAARATDLVGLPPTFIAVGALDLFLEENVSYALRLTRAGVPTELHVYPGAYHGFQVAANSYVAVQAAQDSMNALKRVLNLK